MGKIIIITGAAGYLGQRVVLSAHKRGHHVFALVRPGTDLSTVLWAELDNIDIIEIDLASDNATHLLQALMAKENSETASVIHAAGKMSGDDEVQLTQTVQPTRTVTQAMVLAGLRRLVLVSSMSIYGYSSLPKNSQLDETTPIEPFSNQRDAYCRAKIAQESIVLNAAQTQGLFVTAIRPGAIIGRNNLWTARLGISKKKIGLLLGRNARLPLSYVDDSAEALVLAAEQYEVKSDVYTLQDEENQKGAFEAINVFDDHLPTQQQYINMLKAHTDILPHVIITIPWGIMKAMTSIIAKMTIIWPDLTLRLPGLLGEASLHARIKPLRYNNARLHDRLGWEPKQKIEAVVKSSNPGK